MSNKTIISINPSNYETIGEVEYTSNEEIASKVSKANAAKKAWKELGLEGRIKELRKVATKFSEDLRFPLILIIFFLPFTQ